MLACDENSGFFHHLLNLKTTLKIKSKNQNKCDNRLFERRLDRKFQMQRARSEPTYASVVAKPFSRESYNAPLVSTPTPMEIDTISRRGPLSEEEKQRRRANRLYLYCGGPGHIVVNCPHRPRRQVNQIVASSDCTNSTNSPNLANKFDVLSQLEEE